MNPVMWYQSPVFSGALVSILSQLCVLFGVADKFTPDFISSKVNALMQLVALGSALYALIKRKTSAVQPVALTKAGHANLTAQAQEAIRVAVQETVCAPPPPAPAAASPSPSPSTTQGSKP